MIKRPASLLVFAIAASIASAATAQDPFGFGGTPSPAAPAAPDGAGASAAPLADEDIVVQTIIDSNPDTPDKLMDAAKSMFAYGRPDVAKRFLQKLLTSGADRDALLKLERKYGSALFLKMMRAPELQPEGAQIAEAVLGAEREAAGDQTRLEQLVTELSSPSLSIRTNAARELQAARYEALTPMLHALADKSRSDEHPYIRAAFRMLELDDVQPLIGALDSPDDALRAQVIQVLGLLRSRTAVDYLIEPYLSSDSPAELKQAAEAALERILGAVPTSSDARYYLAKRTREYFDGMQPARVDIDDAVTLWRWDATQQTVVPVRYLAADAPFLAASRTAGALQSLFPDRAEYRRLYLASLLQSEKMLHGLHRPLPRGQGTAHAVASAAGEQDVEAVLDYSISEGLLGAAIGAAEVLGDIGSVQLVYSSDGYPRPLGKALRHADRRLQFAAADAVMKLDPHRDFPGASHAVENLGFVAGTFGVRKTLVVDPQTEVAQSLVGMLAELGYEGRTAATGHQGIRTALADPDFALILISDRVDYCDANELYQMLRKDPRTARTPVGIIAREENLDRWRLRVADDQLASAFPRPADTRAVAFWTGQLFESVGRRALGESERLAQASQALDHLLHLAEDRQRYGFYDLLRQEANVVRALYTPGLEEKAAKLLGLMATPRAQRELVDLASQNTLPLKTRRAAAVAFGNAVSRRGTLLTTKEIVRQYDRYNQSEKLDPDTQQLLGSILDTIEARAAQAKAELQR